jgi:hypothetical protein
MNVWQPSDRRVSPKEVARAQRSRYTPPRVRVVEDQGKRFVAVSAHELLDYYSDCNQPPGHSY